MSQSPVKFKPGFERGTLIVQDFNIPHCDVRENNVTSIIIINATNSFKFYMYIIQIYYRFLQ